MQNATPDTNKLRQVTEELKGESTFLLFLLGMFTGTIYYAFFVKKKTAIINKHLVNDSDKLNANSFFFLLLIGGVIGIGAMVGEVLATSQADIQGMQGITTITNWIYIITIVVWGTKTTNRMNLISGEADNKKASLTKFSPSWGWFFSPLYLNWKVNTINESIELNATPSAPVTSEADNMEQLEKLHGLLQKGILTQDEFDTKKSALLA